MIIITCLNGPFADLARFYEGTNSINPEKKSGDGRVIYGPVDPNELLSSLQRRGWRWESDYSLASEEEKFLWGRAEFAARIVMALSEGRPVYFLDQRFEVGEDESVQDAAQRVEDAIVNSRQSLVVTIGSDDENGVVIATAKYH